MDSFVETCYLLLSKSDIRFKMVCFYLFVAKDAIKNRSQKIRIYLPYVISQIGLNERTGSKALKTWAVHLQNLGVWTIDFVDSDLLCLTLAKDVSLPKEDPYV